MDYKDYSETRKKCLMVKMYVDSTTHDIIHKLSQEGRSKANVCYMLIHTALKYNFDSNLDYICCKPRNKDYISRKKAPKKYSITLCINDKLKNKLDIIKSKLLTSGYNNTARFLIETAIGYDFDDNYKFVSPEHLFNDYISPNHTKSPDIIVLDKI